MARIAAEGRGVIVYLRTGVVPAIGLLADSADESLGAQILADLGIEDPRHLDAEPAARPSSRAVAATGLGAR
jgi:GTP cyclohydrolase II